MQVHLSRSSVLGRGIAVFILHPPPIDGTESNVTVITSINGGRGHPRLHGGMKCGNKGCKKRCSAFLLRLWF